MIYYRAHKFTQQYVGLIRNNSVKIIVVTYSLIQGSEVSLDPLPEDPELHQGLSGEIMIDVQLQRVWSFGKEKPEKTTSLGKV